MLIYFDLQNLPEKQKEKILSKKNIKFDKRKILEVVKDERILGKDIYPHVVPREFLKQNKDFEGKGRAVQYLVDQNISEANIKKGCEKIKFIDSTIRDSYLEKFKIQVFGPNKMASQLEGSKIFTKKLCQKYNIPTAKFGIFQDF